MPHIVDLKTPQNTPSPAQIEWTAPEFEKHEKSSLWFMVLGIVTLIFLIITIILKNYTFAIVILLLVFCVYLYTKKEPREINFSLSHRGVSIGDKLYAYNELKSFWIFYEPPRLKQLSLQSKKVFSPYIRVPLANQNPNQIRIFLLKYLPEIEQEESLIDILSDKIGF